MRLGLISDTHGLLRPQAVAALQGSDRIVHAGDIGKPEILEQLAAIAPVTAVRGNNDTGAWAQQIPQRKTFELDGVAIHLLHDLHELAIDPAAAGIRVVIAGHSHRPLIEDRAGVLFINPGSAGPRRFKLPVSVGMLEIAGGEARARIQLLDV
jgi:hypothetical protein